MMSEDVAAGSHGDDSGASDASLFASRTAAMPRNSALGSAGVNLRANDSRPISPSPPPGDTSMAHTKATNTPAHAPAMGAHHEARVGHTIGVLSSESIELSVGGCMRATLGSSASYESCV